MTVSDDKAGTGAKEPRRQRIARVILVDGCAVKPLKIQTVGEIGSATDIKAEGRRLAEFLYWAAPWKFFNGLQERLNELMPPECKCDKRDVLTH